MNATNPVSYASVNPRSVMSRKYNCLSVESSGNLARSPRTFRYPSSRAMIPRFALAVVRGMRPYVAKRSSIPGTFVVFKIITGAMASTAATSALYWVSIGSAQIANRVSVSHARTSRHP